MKDPNENRPGYKKTKVGWIPKQWETHRISEIAEVSYGLTVNEKRRNILRRRPYLTVANFALDGLKLDNVKEIGCSESDERRYALKLDDILVVEGNGSRELVGAAALWRAQISNVLHQNHLLRIRVLSEDCSPDLLTRLINSGGFRRRLEPQIITSSGLHTINSQTIGNAFVPVPPPSEGKKMSEILTACDGALDQIRDLIGAKKEQKRALMQQLLTGKMRLHGFKERWRRHRINELFKEVTRPVEWDDNEEYSLLSVRRRSGGVFLRERIKGSQIATKVMFVAHSGDFLISRMQVLHGATGLVPSKLDGCHISGSYIALRPKHGDLVDPAFFARLSEMPEFRHLTYICSYGVHIEKMTFNLEWFLDSKVLMPPTLDEQGAIVHVLDAADEEIQSLEEKLQALDQQKTGLMQKLLTGQIRVKV